MPPARVIDDSALTHLVGYAASRAAQEMRKVFARNVGPLGLTASEFSILALAASNGDMNQKQLGQALDISAPNLAVTLDRLAERGWSANASTELELLVFRDTYEDAWRKAYRDLEPANLYNIDYSLLARPGWSH